MYKQYFMVRIIQSKKAHQNTFSKKKNINRSFKIAFHLAKKLNMRPYIHKYTLRFKSLSLKKILIKLFSEKIM